MAIVWTKGVKTGVLTPQQFVAVTSSNCAKLFNLYPRKGRIAVGCDADLVVWDGDATRVISAKTHHHAVTTNIFEGMQVAGIALYTVSRGKVVWENGVLHTVRGAGRYIPRPCFGEAFAGIAASDEARDELKRKVERAPYDGPVEAPISQ
jgi:dihydropyrimidinase